MIIDLANDPPLIESNRDWPEKLPKLSKSLVKEEKYLESHFHAILIIYCTS